MTEEERYSLKKSMEALGQLVPCLKDAQGRDIDGLHRLDNKPDAWVVTHKHIDTPLKRSLARVAVNFCRRTMSPEELRKEIGFQIGCGLKPQDIADQTGIGVSTIYLHMPEQLKDKKKVDAGKVGGEAIAEEYRKSQDSALSLEQTVKTQDMPPRPPAAEHPVKCDSCPIGTGTWFPYRLRDGRVLCQSCFEYLWNQGKIAEEDLLGEGERPPVKPPEKPKRKPEVTEYKPKETAEFKRAQMQPQHSKMENELLLKLQGLGAMRDKEFCVQSTTPDFYFPKQKLAVYVDGPVHEGKEERDSYLRDLLAKRHQVRVVPIAYEAFSKQEVERVFEQIKEALI